MSKVVFLDIEGVLSVYGNICANCCDNLKNILDDTGAKIVLSSSWRLYDNDFSYVVKKLSPSGIRREYFLDKTPSFVLKGRGYEIRQWLNNNIVDSFVVLDDNEIDEKQIPQDNFFQTEPTVGLTQKIAQLCIAKLNLV